MSRYRGPKLRIIRRLGELPGLTQKVCTRNFPPGQHGPNQRTIKQSQYGTQLREKQKLRFNYGITEHQLIRYVREARRRSGSTGENLLKLLETRLDSLIFRAGFTKTIAEARQLITHGHVMVNSQRMNIPSCLCNMNDILSIRDSSRQRVKNSFVNRVNNNPPTHIEVDLENVIARFTGSISRQDIGVIVNELLVVEYYSRRA